MTNVPPSPPPMQDARRAQMRLRQRRFSRSIAGPLLLIATGVAFLLIQLGRFSWYQAGVWFARWWPMILVAVGVVVLIEWIFDQYIHSNDGVPHRRTLGGGVVLLLILITAAGLTATGIHNRRNLFNFNGIRINDGNFGQFLGDRHESEQTLAQALPAGSVLTITNPRGDVTVTGASDDNQVHVAVHKEVYSFSDSDAESKAGQLSPQITAEGGTFSINVPSVDGGRANLTLTVPPATATTISSNHGDVRVSSIKAPVTVTANHGAVALAAITGAAVMHVNNNGSSVSAHSITGPVTVEGHAGDLTFSDIHGTLTADGEFFGSTHLERISDAIRFHTSRTSLRMARLDGAADITPREDLSASQVQGPLKLETRNRNITLDRVSGDISVVNRNGSVDLTAAPPLGSISVENRNGAVNLTLPEHAGFVLQADTNNGDIRNDFGLNPGGDDRHRTLSGTVGKGGPQVRIATAQDNIAIRRASVAPIPAAPPTSAPITLRKDDGSSIVVAKTDR